MPTNETRGGTPQDFGRSEPSRVAPSTDWAGVLACYVTQGLPAVFSAFRDDGDDVAWVLLDRRWASRDTAWEGLFEAVTRGAVTTGDSVRRSLALATVRADTPSARVWQQRTMMEILRAMQRGTNNTLGEEAAAESLQAIVYRYVADRLMRTPPDDPSGAMPPEKMPVADLHECTRTLVRWGHLDIVAAARHAGCAEDVLGAALMTVGHRSQKWVATIAPVGAAMGWPRAMAAAVRATMVATVTSDNPEAPWSEETVALCSALVAGPAMAHLAARLGADGPDQSYDFRVKAILRHWRTRDDAWWAALPAESWPDLLRSRNMEIRMLALTHLVVAAPRVLPAPRRQPAPPHA